MKYINYLFIFTFVFVSTLSFAQEGPVSSQDQLTPLPLNSVEHYDYTEPEQARGEIPFHFQADQPGILAIASEGIKGSISVIRLYDSYKQKLQTIGARNTTPHINKGFFIIPDAGRYIVEVQFQLPQQLSQLQQEIKDELNGALGEDVDIGIQIASNLFSDDDQNNNPDSQSPQMIRIASSFTPTTAFASFFSGDKDGDSNPSVATNISPDNETAVSASVGGNNDLWDWWKVVGECKLVRFVATTENGDIVLESYPSGEDTLTMEDGILSDNGASGADEVEMDVWRLNDERPIAVRVRPYWMEQGIDIPYTLKVEECLN